MLQFWGNSTIKFTTKISVSLFNAGVLVLCFALQAQDVWEYADVFGGNVSPLAKAPDGTLYAGIDHQVHGHGAVFRSIDGGLHWQMTAQKSLSTELVIVADNGDVYAVVEHIENGRLSRASILRSSDRGDSWATILDHLSWGPALAVRSDGTICVTELSLRQLKTFLDFGETWQDVELPDGPRHMAY